MAGGETQEPRVELALAGCDYEAGQLIILSLTAATHRTIFSSRAKIARSSWGRIMKALFSRASFTRCFWRQCSTLGLALTLSAAIAASNVRAAAPDGQLWFAAEGNSSPGSTSTGSSDNQIGHVNSDGGARAVADVNTDAVSGNTAGFSGVGLDTAAGLYFAYSVDGFLRCGRITNDTETGQASQLSQVQMIYSANGPATADEVNAFAVDVAHHIIYVGLWGQTETTSGLLEVTYNPVTGALTSPYNASNATITDSSHVLLTSASTTPGNTFVNVVGMNYIPSTQKLYYVDQTNGVAYSGGSNETWPATNGIFVIDTTAANPQPTRLTTTAQFPAGDTSNSNYMSGLVVDTAKSLIYFTVNDAQTTTASSKLFYMPITGGTATQMSMPSGVTLDFATYFGNGSNPLTLDPSAQVLYISLETPFAKGGGASRNDSRIVALTLSTNGQSFSSGNDNFFKLDTNDLVTSYTNGLAFDVLPVLSVTGTSAHAPEQSTAITLATGSSLTDIDNTSLAGFSVQITGGTFSSNETSVDDDHLTFNGSSTGTVGGTSIAYSYNSASETLTFTGDDTLAHYQTALAGVQYNTTGDNPTNYGNNPTRTLVWIASDGLTVANGTQNEATTTLTIDAVNDPPSVSAGSTVSYSEQQASPTAIATALTTTDPDNLNLAGATITISNGFLAADMLNFTNQNGIAGSYNGGSGTLALSGSATLANYQTALRSITFSSTSDNPTNFGTDTSRTINFVVNDGLLNSTASTSTVNVIAVNDPPVVNAGGSVGYTELASAIVLDGAITTSDVDNQTLAGATVTISGGFFAGDTLTFVNQNGITGNYNSASGLLSLSGTASIANYQAALASVTFSSSSHNPTNFGTDTNRTISYVVNDGAANSSASTSTVTITAVNDAPMNIVPGAQNAQQGLGQEIAGISISDVDADPATDSMTTTLSVIHGTLSIGIPVGGAAVGNNGTATVTLTGTQNQINTSLAATNNVVYTATATYLGADTLTVTTNDNGHTGTGGALQAENTVPITVTVRDEIFKDGFDGS
jgi:hypothetical protein